MDEPGNELVHGSGLALLSWPGRRGVGGASCGQPRRCLGQKAWATSGHQPPLKPLSSANLARDFTPESTLPSISQEGKPSIFLEAHRAAWLL